jgi:chromosome segregation ATPase
MKYFLILLCSFQWIDFAEAQQVTAEAKLRESVKAMTAQVQNLNAEKLTMQAAITAAETKAKDQENAIKELTKRVDEMTRELATTKEEATRVQAEQAAKITATESDLKKHRETLDKWKAAHTEITAIAKKKEAERAKYAAQAKDVERRANDYKTKNLELYKVGTEILERLRKFAFGEALAAREPFLGNAKVKLQALVQDYQDKLLDQTAKP